MKKIILSMLLVLFSFLPAQIAIAQAVEVPVGAFTIFFWDPVTEDITGAPENVVTYEIGAWPAGTDLINFPDTVPLGRASIDANLTQCDAGLFLLAITTARVRIAVRAIDAAGNVSDWSDSLDCVLDFKKPKNLRWDLSFRNLHQK